jgi:hypothetical protein
MRRFSFTGGCPKAIHLIRSHEGVTKANPTQELFHPIIEVRKRQHYSPELIRISTGRIFLSEFFASTMILDSPGVLFMTSPRISRRHDSADTDTVSRLSHET